MMRSKQDATQSFLERDVIPRAPQLTEKNIRYLPNNRPKEQQAEREDSRKHLQEASLCFILLQYNGDTYLQQRCIVVPQAIVFSRTDTTDTMFNEYRN